MQIFTNLLLTVLIIIIIFYFKYRMATTIIRHFKFSDYNLAQKVRGKMLRDLSDFDVNKNMLFDSG